MPVTERSQNHPFIHCSVPMILSERTKHPRIPFHEVMTFICRACHERITVTGPILIAKPQDDAH
jgi:hypothetical protein